MSRRFRLVLMLLAWLLATGIQWDLLQLVAWGNMIAGYSRTMSAGEAVTQTFDPSHLCPLCQMVKRAKQDSAAGATGSPIAARPLLLVPPTPAIVVAAPRASSWSLEIPAFRGQDRSSPLLTPPRMGQA